MIHTIYQTPNYASIALVLVALVFAFGEFVNITIMLTREQRRRTVSWRTVKQASVPAMPKTMPPMPEVRPPRETAGSGRLICLGGRACTIDLQELDLRRTEPPAGSGKEAED